MRNVLLVFVIIACSCTKNETELFTDSKYPTIYKALANDDLNSLRATFQQNNRYIQSTLNEFGFCDFMMEEKFYEHPPLSAASVDIAAANVMDFVSRNKTYTGIPDIRAFKIKGISISGQNGNYIHFKSENQKIDTVEVLHTSIIFHTLYNEVYYCTGNWYPEIYIPMHFNITASKARQLLLNKMVPHSTIGADTYHVKISQTDIDKSSTRLVIYPLKNHNRIELRVTWEITLPLPAGYIFHIDVMTGETIHRQPNIIS